jgi:3',5'-cyclic AMP phosphodiesterase CpdA
MSPLVDMRFSILHLSDLHRDLRNEVENGPLLNSLLRDIRRYSHQTPPLLKPSICIVSGDLIYGVKPTSAAANAELSRQFDQAVDFLAALTDNMFDGDRDRVILLPGNHDVSYPATLASTTRIDLPAGASERKALTDELFAPKSRLRWSWSEVCFYRITDEAQYEQRLSSFAAAYERFYAGKRSFELSPEDQFQLFDYSDLALSVLALNSCYRNDPLRRAGGFHPTAFSAACREAQLPKRAGWLLAATWHHSVSGGPLQDDYLDGDFIQQFIDSGISLGFHGHQHSHDCVDERYRLGPAPRKITLVSASTLCAEARNLKPGVPRGYNLVELDTDAWTGRAHSRHMVNSSFDLPVWGPGHFYSSGKSYVDFDICPPASKRPGQLDTTLALSEADEMLANKQWAGALKVLNRVKGVPLARPLVLKALAELADDERTLETLWPPLTSAEIVLVGGAILNQQNPDAASAFLQLETVSTSSDASVVDIRQRLLRRWPQ